MFIINTVLNWLNPPAVDNGEQAFNNAAADYRVAQFIADGIGMQQAVSKMSNINNQYPRLGVDRLIANFKLDADAEAARG